MFHVEHSAGLAGGIRAGGIQTGGGGGDILRGLGHRGEILAHRRLGVAPQNPEHQKARDKEQNGQQGHRGCQAAMMLLRDVERLADARRRMMRF